MLSLSPSREGYRERKRDKETDEWLEALLIADNRSSPVSRGQANHYTSDLNHFKRTPQMTGTQSTGNKHMAGLKCLGESWGRPRRKLYHSQQPSNMTGPKPPLWRKWGSKECLLRCVVITEASPLRPRPSTQRAPFSIQCSDWKPVRALCLCARDMQGRQVGTVGIVTAICLSPKLRATEKHRIKGIYVGKKTGSILQDIWHHPGEIISLWKLIK